MCRSLVTKQSAAICALLVSVTIIAALSLPSFSQATSEESSFKLGWKLPVGSIRFPSLSGDASLILLPALFDGYYLYDSNGGLIRRIADPYAMMGGFSSDEANLLLGRETGGRPAVSFIDRSTMRDAWNYSLDAVHYGVISCRRPSSYLRRNQHTYGRVSRNSRCQGPERNRAAASSAQRRHFWIRVTSSYLTGW